MIQRKPSALPRREPDGKTQVDAYIAAAPKPARAMLRQIRQVVRASAPQADERLSYRMPYYGYHGRLVYFAAFARHVSVFVMGRAKERFAAQMEPFRTSPSTLQFPLGSRVPVTLLKRLIRARVQEIDADRDAPRPKSRKPARATARTRAT